LAAADVLSRIRIDSAEKETEIVEFLSHILNRYREAAVAAGFHSVNFAIVQKIAVIASFLSEFWFSRWRLVVNLNHFLGPLQIVEFVGICCRFDRFSLMTEILSAWAIDGCSFLFERLLERIQIVAF
jgi:hypothetical protein